jgi:hypothetical protein
MNGYREAWAWTVSMLSLMGGWLATPDNWLVILGVVVAALTAVERFYAIRLRKKQLAMCAPPRPPDMR